MTEDVTVVTLCECGCGEIPNKGSRYLFNHHRRGTKHTEESRNKIAEAGKGRLHSEESKKKMSESNKGNFPNTETRKKMSISQFKRFKNPENHYNWRGGISREKQSYGIEFNNELREVIRDKYNRACQLCGIEEKEFKNNFCKKLDVHHIDYNKKNNIEDNLIPLCKSCHTKTTNSNREEYENQLKKLVI
jgi:predicted restriction endonuclease